MRIKKLIKAFCCVMALAFFTCGCAFSPSNPEYLLSAPKLTGEMQPVQEALDEKIEEKYQLKFPTVGDTKSAITLVDITGDNKSEAVAFFSTSANNSVNMHIAIIDFIEGRWTVTAVESVIATGVESAYFTDMDGDKVKEIIVGWNVYGNTSKTVSVYEYSGNTLISLMQEPYSVFTLCDLDGNLSQDILLLNHDLTTSSSLARYFSINSQGVSELGNCETDGNITSYNTPIVSALPSGEFCVYIDCIKGAGMITEAIVFSDSKLKNPFYDTALMENTITYRPANVPCRDFDGDSHLDIPVMTEQPTDATVSTSAAYLTVWNTFDGEKLTPAFYTLMNYSDGYSIRLTKELAEKTATVRNLENRERIVREYDYEKNEFRETLFSIRVVSKSAFDSGAYSEGYVNLAQGESSVWLASVSQEAKKYNITKDNIKEMFSLIMEE